MKKISSIIGILVIVLVLGGCFPKDNEAKSEFVLVTIADRNFKIPRGYFDGRSPSGKDTESVVLEYALPDFKILPTHPLHREERQKLIQAGLMRSMLLEAERNRPPAHVSAENLMRGRNYQKQEGDFWGLEKYQRPKETGKYPVVWDDFFIERNKRGEIISFLFCSPPDKDKVPSCNHRFMDKGLVYQIHWNIRELKNWQQQKKAAINFIDSLEIHEVERN
ncbi:MAG TPA: hypothetical protein PLF01_06175 [Alphaproteobacteria bacterium]|nr:hypothetical protein [Alphaproteobacteria bacterium]